MISKRLRVLFTCFVGLICVFVAQERAAAQGWSNGYGYRRAITIDHTKVPNSDQTNFPVLISGTFSYLATFDNGGEVASPSGFDIIFTSDAAGTNLLAYETESYSPITGAATFWVKVPTLSHTSDTTIYLFYGNAAISTDQSNKSGTWDANYSGVWHFTNAGSAFPADSTSHAYNLTNNNSVIASTGQIGGAASFSGSNYLSNSLLSITAGTSITISFWDYVSSSSLTQDSTFTIGGADAPNRIQADCPWSDSTLYWDYGSYSAGGRVSTSYSSYLNQWAYVVLEYDSAQSKHAIYINGVLAASSINSNVPQTTQTGIKIGAWPTSYYHKGGVDEFRVSTNARSSDWIAAEYANQNAPSTFYSIGSEDGAGTGGTASPSIASISPTSGPVTVPVTIYGTNFEASQGYSTVSFNGTTAYPTRWTSFGIVVPVPSSATSGNVVVNVGGVPSNGANFNITSGPGITGISPRSGPVGTAVRIEGLNLGTSGTVTLNGTVATTTSWSSNLIVALVPSGATSGMFAVTVGGQTVYTPGFSISALPPGWLDQDIGTVGITGNANFANGVFTMNAAGSSLYATSDKLHFVYQTLSGDGSIVARVVSSSSVSTPQAGVMIRESMDPGSKEAIAQYVPNLSTLYSRATAATYPSYQQDGSLPSGTHPYWMKLTRSGNTITGYDSMDGINWNQIGSSPVTVTMATNVYIGLAFTANSNTSLGTANFDNVSVSTSTTPAPQITSLSATTGNIGSQVTIYGSGFGSYESGSLVYLNGALVPTTAWSDTAITVTIPSGASSGPFVVSVAPGMNDSNPVTFTITTQPLPSLWEDIEIGSGGASGGATYANGTFSVGNSQQSLNSSSDKTHLVYQMLSGDGSIVARVANLAGTNPQAGVMIRESFDPGSKYAFVFYSPNQGYMYLRSTTGANYGYQSTGLTSSSTPYWVKLTRVGNSFTGYVSLNGISWLQIGTSQTITMAQNVYIGLSAGNGSSTLNAAAGVFDNVSVSSNSSPAPVITGISATTGSVGSQIVLNGSGFGSSQGNSLVYLNGAAATINSWSSNWITFTIPSGATSGYLVVSVAPSMNDSNPVVFEVTTQPLPVPWLNQDIATPGGVGTAGTATYSSGAFTVTSTGSGFGVNGGYTDNFHFVYQPLSGDGTVIAHISSVSGGSTDMAGIDLRESLDPGATHVFAYFYPNQGQEYYRSTTGAGNASQGSGYITTTPPYWIKVTRSGNLLNGYISLDGVTWTAIGSTQTITMAQTVYVGLGLSSGSTGQPVTVVFDNVSVSTGTPYPTPVVASVSPTTAGPNYAITITGANFGPSQGTSQILFNGAAAAGITSWSDTQVVATVPNNATTGPVTAVVNNIGSNRTVSLAVYNPIITSVSPPAAPIGGSVVLSGTGFNYSTYGRVKFNGIEAGVTNWTSTSITAIVPSGATSGSITVTVNGIQSAGASFTLSAPATVTSISPSMAPVGSTVTIIGSGFGSQQSTNGVNFYATPATTTSWSDTQIQAVVPQDAVSGKLYVMIASLATEGPVFTMTSTLSLRDSLGNQSTYQSVMQGGKRQPLQIQGSGCSTCTARGNQNFTYDSNGNVLSKTDELGRTTSYTYDSNGNVLTATVPLTSTTSATTTYTYNGFGEVLTSTDPLGNVTTNTYDPNGNLQTVTTPSPDGSTAGSVTHFAYDTKGELISITDPLGHQTSIAYFPTGLIQTITDAQSHVTTYAYDSRGNRASVTDANNQQTTFTYDAMNRLTKITYPDTTTTQFGYDYRGRRASVMDQNGKTTTYAYDDADRLTIVTDAASNATTYAYDTENNLISITDANQHTTTLNYDAFGRVTKTTFPSSSVETYSYDSVGNLLTKTDRKNQAINYAYDYANRLTQKTYPDSTTVNYTYDNDSRLTQVTDPTGTYSFTFDNMGRLTGTTTNYAFLTSRSFTTSYSYDAASNRIGFTDPESGSTTYAYDTLNRLRTLTPPSAFTTGSFGFTYDTLSRRTQMTRPNGVTTNYAYDNLSRLNSVLHQLSGSIIDGAAYTVDNAGNRTAKTDNRTNVTTSYGYDAIYQLLSATQGASTTESYMYDPVGNRTASLGVFSYTTNSSNELTATSNASYGYDYNGSTVTKNDSTGITTYAWDYENRLTSVTLPGSGGTVSFKYDPWGRRIYKSSSSGTSIYAYDNNGNLAEEANAAGTAVARYSDALSTDEPLAMLRSGATIYYHADGLGSITSLSNSVGSLVQTYAYDSFGKQSGSSGSVINPFTYTSREVDSETTLYYYRNRYYDSNLGRFISEDKRSMGSLKEVLNLYPYVLSNPVNFNDPLGFYRLKPDVDYPNPRISALLDCIEWQTGVPLLVTSTSEPPPFSPHGPNDPHRRNGGLAVDLHYPDDPEWVLNGAACCGAKYARNENFDPSSHSTHPHLHIQLVPGPDPGNPGGHLPKNPICKGCK